MAVRGVRRPRRDRSVTGRWRAAVPALGLVLALGAAACGGTQGAAGRSGGHGGVRPAGRTASSGLPDAARLDAALLTAHDINLRASPGSASAGGVGVTGCEPLADLLGAPAPAGQLRRQASFVGAAAGGPFVQEALTTEARTRLDTDYGRLRGALDGCRSLTFGVGGTKLKMALTPITFGGPGSAAKRMDATVQGIRINGYLAVERIGPVVLGYAYMQAGSGSSQLASAYFQQAESKVEHAFGGSTLRAAGRSG